MQRLNKQNGKTRITFHPAKQSAVGVAGKTDMRAKCKQCNKEMQGLVSRMKQHHEKCSFSGGSCTEDDERNMPEHAGSSGESILNIQDSEDYPPSRSPSFSIISELSANDSVSVT
ncbi:hypothetical protein UY3_14638 [Chelonia mydas]|uniref:Uncharacterized protein n=1 Tax=Chelonia mydas TaxID=8469 RepID=M7AYS5_CHEMY|nr:hypothetical protein UY3_14638 [Chelonia mydas]